MGEFPHSDVPKSFRHFFVGIEASIFHRLAVCWKAALFRFTLALCCGNKKHTPLSPCPRHLSVLLCSSNPGISFIRCFLSLSVCPSISFSPSPSPTPLGLLSSFSLNCLHPFKVQYFPWRRESGLFRNNSLWFIYQPMHIKKCVFVDVLYRTTSGTCLNIFLASLPVTTFTFIVKPCQ